jgi:hypothetical protein
MRRNECEDVSQPRDGIDDMREKLKRLRACAICGSEFEPLHKPAWTTAVGRTIEQIERQPRTERR